MCVPSPTSGLSVVSLQMLVLQKACHNSNQTRCATFNQAGQYNSGKPQVDAYMVDGLVTSKTPARIKQAFECKVLIPLLSFVLVVQGQDNLQRDSTRLVLLPSTATKVISPTNGFRDARIAISELDMKPRLFNAMYFPFHVRLRSCLYSIIWDYLAAVNM